MDVIGTLLFSGLKKRFHISLLLFPLFCSPTSALAQNLSGVINTYAHIIAYDSCTNEIRIPSTTGFAVGDTVLLLVMQGAPIDTSNTSNFGYPRSTSAGDGEFAEISAIPDGTHLQFKNYLQKHYVGNSVSGPGGTLSSQVISIPHFANATITGTLTAVPWNPLLGIGGVLTLRVFDTLVFDADIDVSGLGFRGGNPSQNGGIADFPDYYCSGSTANGGFKGEGIAGTLSSSFDAGRGAVANGGGGGNSHNSGGGGGSGYGAGGAGGRETDEPAYAGDFNGGIGGWKDTTALLVLGGGGGGGHQNDGKGSAGGNGGGVVIIFANEIVGNGHAIRANGINADTSDVDGAGGGGGGGSIGCHVDHVSGTLELSADGGNGGDADAGNGALGFGPGGGGGGGRISSNALPGITMHESGGFAGKLRNCSDPSLTDSMYGAMAGMVGDTVNGGIYSSSNRAFFVPGADDHSLSTCAGSLVTISASGGQSYLWSPSIGMSDPTLPQEMVSPNDSTLYTVQITRGACLYSDTVRVNILSKPLAIFSGPLNVCSGSTETYSIPQQKGTSYVWSVAGGAPASGTGNTISVTWNSAGAQTISLIATNGECSDSSQLAVTVAAPISPHLSATNLILADTGDTSILSLNNVYASYLWSTGATGRTLTIDSAGVYSVTVIDSNGCTGTDSIDIELPSELPFIELGLPNISAKPGDHVILPIKIIASRNIINANPASFTYVFHYDQSLLEPLDPAATSSITNGERYVTKRGMISNQLTTDTLDRIELLAALGDATQTAISLDTVIWASGKPIITKLDTGQFTLLGVCPAGGNRLFEANGTLAINGVAPNPVTDNAVADFSLAEPGETTLELLDMLGRPVLTLMNSSATPGEYRLPFDASSIPNGMYDLLLRTPTQTLTKQVEVYH